MRNDNKVMKHLNASFVTTEKGNIKNLKATNDDKHPMVLVTGNRFMNGEFVPASELEKVYKQWDGTYHNLNHGRNFDGRVMVQEIVGIHTDTQMKDNDVVTNVIEGEKTALYDAWKGFLALNQKAGKPTNVSMEVWANAKPMRYSEIKHLVSKDDRYLSKREIKDDDEVTVLVDFEPAGGATVDVGAGGDECSYIGKEDTIPITTENKEPVVDTNEASITVNVIIPDSMTQTETKKEIIVEDKQPLMETKKIEEKKAMAEEQKPTEPKETVAIKTEQPNEEMVALKKQIDELKKSLTEMQTRPVTTMSDGENGGEWFGLTAVKKLKENINKQRKE